MNTPAHVVLNAVVLGRGRARELWFPITAGALVPDLPMFGFYAFERFALARPERTIWSEAYFRPEWQALFDACNSIPLVALGALIAWKAGRTGWLVFFLSMGLHCLEDLPLHNDDAHAHFYPFSNWHFHSPVSYWDPRHYGYLFGAAEVVLVVACSIALMRKSRARPWRIVGTITLVLYAGLMAMMVSFWLSR